jgi:hypothetical protein
VGSRSRARARAKASEAAGPPSQKAVPAVSGVAESPRPPTMSVAVVVEALEAVLVLAAAVLAGVATSEGHSYQLSSGIAITIIGVATAAGLGLVSAGLRHARRWTRTPALLTQLFVGIVGIYLVQGGRYPWGVPALALAVAGFVSLLAPPSTRALTAGLPQPAGRRRRD